MIIIKIEKIIILLEFYYNFYYNFNKILLLYLFNFNVI